MYFEQYTNIVDDVYIDNYIIFLENSISNYYSTINKQLLIIYDNNWNIFIINNNKIHKDLNYFEIFNKEYLINKQNEYLLLLLL